MGRNGTKLVNKTIITRKRAKMKNNQIFQYFNISIIVAVFAIATFAKSEEKLNAPPEGFTALFNGKDFTGWNPYYNRKHLESNNLKPDENHYKTIWTIHKDGTLSIFNGIDGMDKKNRPSPHLGTQKVFKNFTIQLEFLPGMGSIFFRSSFYKTLDDKKTFVKDYNIWAKVQALSSAAGTLMMSKGCWKGISEEDYQHNNYFTAVKIRPELKKNAPQPARGGSKNRKTDYLKKGIWTKMEFTVIGKQIWSKINGKVVTDGVTIPNLPNEGIIVLQNHNTGASLDFRNIFIKELP